MNEELIMASRIQEIIEYKTNGNKAEFARLMGWSKQYLHNLLSGSTAVGLTPVSKVLSMIPELNARWLITGEGNMIDSASNILRTWFTLEPYIPVMTPEERNNIERGQGYTLADIEKWQTLALQRKEAINARFAASYAKQK